MPKMDTKKLVEVLVFVFFAVALLPIIGSQVITLEGDTTNFSATEVILFGLITTFLVIGIVYTIVKIVL